MLHGNESTFGSTSAASGDKKVRFANFNTTASIGSSEGAKRTLSENAYLGLCADDSDSDSNDPHKEAQSVSSSVSADPLSQSSGSLATWISSFMHSVIIPVQSMYGNIQEHWKNNVDTTYIAVPGGDKWIKVQHDKAFEQILQGIIEGNESWMQRLTAKRSSKRKMAVLRFACSGSTVYRCQLQDGRGGQSRPGLDTGLIDISFDNFQSLMTRGSPSACFLGLNGQVQVKLVLVIKASSCDQTHGGSLYLDFYLEEHCLLSS